MATPPSPPTPSTEEAANIVMNKLHFRRNYVLHRRITAYAIGAWAPKNDLPSAHRAVGRRCSRVKHNAQNATNKTIRRNLTLLNKILTTGAILAGTVGSFGAACKVDKDWKGCSEEEAARKIRDFVNGKVTVPLSQDQGLHSEMCQGLDRKSVV